VRSRTELAKIVGMDEAVLIEKARQGHVESFNALVLAYQSRVYNLAYRIMGEEETAADAAQDAFISAYRNLNSFRDGHFGAWLMRIATHICYDELRRRKRRPVVSLDEPDSESRWIGTAESPEGAALRAELSRAIQACLDELPPDQRAVAVLCDIQGYDYQEIAGITAVSLGTVKSRLSRARARLRDCLGQLKELLPDLYRQTLQSKG
jgi:RNA polymerase sigma-70 factor (ECF subfamily)